MRKNSYLLELANKAEHFNLHIYGNADGLPGIDKAPHAVCYPFIPADEFIRSADGDFGLVWDGDSTEACTGDWGEYLRINDPHKTSFYLRAGIPVIVWSQAAMAPFIESSRVGIAVDGLSRLKERLDSLSEADYRQMLQNAQAMGRQLAEGYYIKQGLAAAFNYLEGLR